MNSNIQLKKQIDDCFEYFVSFLEKNEIEYMLGHGAFLSLIRDHKINYDDKDIDFYIHVKYLNELVEKLDDLMKLGWKLKIGFVNGLVYAFDFKDVLKENRQKFFQVSFMIYRLQGDKAWIPIVRRDKSSTGTVRDQVKRFKYNLYRTSKQYLPGVKDRYFFLWRDAFELRTWFLQAKYLLNRKKYHINGFNFFAPADYEGYLQSMYGNWEEPKEDWDVWKDDQTLEGSPGDVVGPHWRKQPGKLSELNIDGVTYRRRGKF